MTRWFGVCSASRVCLGVECALHCALHLECAQQGCEECVRCMGVLWPEAQAQAPAPGRSGPEQEEPEPANRTVWLNRMREWVSNGVRGGWLSMRGRGGVSNAGGGGSSVERLGQRGPAHSSSTGLHL